MEQRLQVNGETWNMLLYPEKSRFSGYWEVTDAKLLEMMDLVNCWTGFIFFFIIDLQKSKVYPVQSTSQ